MLERLKSLLPVTNFSQENLHILKVPWPFQIATAGSKDSNPRFPQWIFSIKLKLSSLGPQIVMVHLMARTFSISLMLPLSLLYFTVFLLIIREVHIINPEHPHFPHFHVCPSHTWDPSSKGKKKIFFKKVQFGALSILGAQPLKENRVLPHHIPDRSHQL